LRCIYALNATIQTAIEVEIGWFGDAGSIGEDLLVDDSATSDHTKRTPEETEERNRNMDLISRQAEKRKEKIDRAQAGAGTRQVNDFQAPALAEPSNLIVERVLSAMSVIFSGPPVSAEARRFHRPLTDTEKCAFAWRRLIDSASQENTDTFPWPLCNVAFVWKCSDDEKWSCAVNLLMVIYNGANIKRSEQALVKGQIGEMEYADQSQNARIYAVEKIVKDLRDSYDPVWEPDMLAADQRAIFAVCSTENSYSEQHAFPGQTRSLQAVRKKAMTFQQAETTRSDWKSVEACCHCTKRDSQCPITVEGNSTPQKYLQILNETTPLV
jgi:hypothetical protein